MSSERNGARKHFALGLMVGFMLVTTFFVGVGFKTNALVFLRASEGRF